MKIYYSSRFIRELKKLNKEKQKQAYKKEKLFRQNQFAPTLKTHKLTGELADLWSFSITYQDRIIFEFTKDDEVTFIRIGSHDIYNR